MKNAKQIKKYLRQFGEKLGYISFSEVELVEGEILDVVGLDKRYKLLYGKLKPKLWKSLAIISIAFEIELNAQNTKAVRGSINTLSRTSAALNVIVVSKDKIGEFLKKYKHKKQSKWSNYENIVKNLKQYIQRSSTRIILMPIEDLEKMSNLISI